MSYGALKYDEENWKKCRDPKRYLGAAMRHLLAIMDGEHTDVESGLKHAAHAAVSIMMATWVEENGGRRG